ncbi:hypothetical protein TNCV_4057851 [Trichonephila clavipes]|nr:hypothetical protein TNCV_4057851 [Trichonephila clavipes]
MNSKPVEAQIVCYESLENGMPSKVPYRHLTEVTSIRVASMSRVLMNIAPKSNTRAIGDLVTLRLSQITRTLLEPTSPFQTTPPRKRENFGPGQILFASTPLSNGGSSLSPVIMTTRLFIATIEGTSIYYSSGMANLF